MKPDTEKTDAEKYVIGIHPMASCFGPVNAYWPGQVTIKGVWLVTSAPHMRRSIGIGSNEIEAWASAANRILAEVKP